MIAIARTRGAPVPRDEAQTRSAGHNDIDAVRRDAAACRACPLWERATQTVFGEGPRDARLLFVGEQPGDREDLQGRPFVGPAGQLFDEALVEAGIDRSITYVTNAVKHFKFEPRGKRRIHAKPSGSEIDACRWWLGRELELIDPELVVALGATALQALAGKILPVTANRGTMVEGASGRGVFVTVHPSFLLRLPDPTAKRREYARFVEDLRAAAGRLATA
jgi:uracil-DNA glycosylase